MKDILPRRQFIQTLLTVPLLPLAGPSHLLADAVPGKKGKLKISLNAYSFNKPLSEGSMSLGDLLEFCAAQEIDGVDLTGYYFPGYPSVPDDKYLYELKRQAFRLGVDISGSGVRNDFGNPDPEKRRADVALIMNWIIAASKIGAPVLRIFSGTQKVVDGSWNKVAAYMTEAMQECAAFGAKHGVIVAVQNHNDFLQTGDQVIEIIRKVNSPWFGLILDIGSFRQGDPYEEIAKTIPYAVNWQIKELVYEKGAETRVDLQKLIPMIKSSAYAGYLPIETLGPGDPYQKVPVFLNEVRKALV